MLKQEGAARERSQPHSKRKHIRTHVAVQQNLSEKKNETKRTYSRKKKTVQNEEAAMMGRKITRLNYEKQIVDMEWTRTYKSLRAALMTRGEAGMVKPP